MLPKSFPSRSVGGTLLPMAEINLGCALAGPVHGPWHLHVTCFFVEIMFWAPWISQIQTAGLPSFFLTSQPVVNVSPYYISILLATLIINLQSCTCTVLSTLK